MSQDGGDPTQSDTRKAGLPRRTQFGVLEFLGLVVAIAVLYTVVIRSIYEPPYRRYGPRDRPELGLQFLAFGIASIFAGMGSYVSARFATHRGIRSAVKRLALQAVCIPLLICCAAAFLYAVIFVAIVVQRY